MEIKCTSHLCSQVFDSCENWLEHMKNVHINDETFLCSFCLKEFSKLWRLRRHVKGCSNREIISTPSDAGLNFQDVSQRGIEEPSPWQEILDYNQFNTLDRLLCEEKGEISVEVIEENIFNLMLNMYGKMSVPKSAAMETLHDINDKILTPLVTLMIEKNGNTDFPENLRSSLDKIIRTHGTNHNFKEMVKSKNLFFDPICFKIPLPHNLTNRARYSNGFILPIQQNLKSFFDANIEELDSMLKLHKELISRDDGVIESEVQCSVWKDKMKNFEGLNVIPYRLYQDDFEINNAIGSKSGAQKISGIYLSFPLMGEYKFYCNDVLG